MVFIPEEVFHRSITPTYYTGRDYLDFDRIESSVLEDFGIGTRGDRNELLRLFDDLKGRKGHEFYERLSSSLERAQARLVTTTLRVLTFLSSIPAGEEFLPLILDDGEVHLFDLRPLKLRGKIKPEELGQYFAMLRALQVDRLVGDPDFSLRPVLTAVKVGTEGNLRKSRSGKMMVLRCNEIMHEFVKENRERWDRTRYTPEGELGRVSIADTLGAGRVSELLKSLDSGMRSITAREIQKKVDGMLTVSTGSGELLVPCEFNAYFSSAGSKPSEIRRAYGYLSDHLPAGVALLWVTDGRLFLNREMSALDGLGRALVDFNRYRTRAQVLTPRLIPEYLPTFIEENLALSQESEGASPSSDA